MEERPQPFPFGQKGIIISGEYPSWSVEIVDDRVGETGGYFIYILDPDPERKDFMGFDWWFEHAEHIPRFIEDMDWQIEWSTAN